MHSCLYRGWVRHRRFTPTPNRFRYLVFLLYLDLDELDQIFVGRPLWSVNRSNVASFQRRDHFGDPRLSLDQAVRNRVERDTGQRPQGRIGLLTHLRYFGYVMNPVSFYYCYSAAGDAVDTIVAEIHNTPWGERHCYVLDESQNAGTARHKHYRFRKTFHVSPFLPMDMIYDWHFRVPDEHLTVHMNNICTRNGREQIVFDATMSLQRRPMAAKTLYAALVRHPFMTAKVITAIYWQALRLWRQRTPFYSHPAPPRSIGRLPR